VIRFTPILAPLVRSHAISIEIGIDLAGRSGWH
jgi:hypothetical protein